MQWNPDVVESTFICEFHNEVAVQTDFNAQVSFLPELLKSYMNDDKHENVKMRSPTTPPSSSNSPNASSTDKQAEKIKKDLRQYICRQWVIDPKIRFIDRFKWNPPIVDEILKKLQVRLAIRAINTRSRSLTIERPSQKSCNEEFWIVATSLSCHFWSKSLTNHLENKPFEIMLVYRLLTFLKSSASSCHNFLNWHSTDSLC
jgi:hypothetical protein